VIPATGVTAWTLATAVIGFRVVSMGPFMRGDKAVEVVGARGVLRVAVGLGLFGTTVGRALRTIDVWFAVEMVDASVGLRALRM
jgi:hypothetical protein